MIEPGGFRTDGPKKVGASVTTSTGFSHPAYTSPSLPSNAIRAFFQGDSQIGADPAKAVQRIYELSLLSSPPLRLVLGKDAIAVAQAEIKSIEQDVAKYQSWSEGLEFDA